jgi:anti-anti-sigma regulatory factor
MNITITKTEPPFPVTIMHLEGKLDGANYESLIEEAATVHAGGAHDLVLDLGQLTYISSAGLSALHQVALLFRGEKDPGQDVGWAAYRAIGRDRGSGPQEHVKLLSPSHPVMDVLEMTGFISFFEIFDNLSEALASFAQKVPVR